MSKVLVDRELLERCVDRWACCAIVETPGAEQAWLELRAVVKAAQPAEAEGALPDRMEVAPYQTVDRGSVNYRCGWNAYRKEAIAALSAVTAERDRLQEEMAELWKRIDKFQSQAHGITALAEIERLRAESEALRADAERFRWLAHQGDACQWMNIIRVDPDDFESYAEAVDAAMAAKEV